jgi:hypothetical protein
MYVYLKLDAQQNTKNKMESRKLPSRRDKSARPTIRPHQTDPQCLYWRRWDLLTKYTK